MEAKPEYEQLLRQFKMIRKGIGYSQVRTVKYVDVAQHTLSRMESGVTVPRLDIFLEMVKGLGYTLALVPMTMESAKIIEKVIVKELPPEPIDYENWKYTPEE